jgi:hypothetical protein
MFWFGSFWLDRFETWFAYVSKRFETFRNSKVLLAFRNTVSFRNGLLNALEQTARNYEGNKEDFMYPPHHG